MMGKEYTMEAEVAMESTQRVVQKAAKEANPLFDSLFCTKIKYLANGRWHEIEISAREFCEIMASGEFEGRQIAAMQLFQYSSDTENEAGEEVKVRMIYNFVEKHTNGNPWQMI